MIGNYWSIFMGLNVGISRSWATLEFRAYPVLSVKKGKALNVGNHVFGDRFYVDMFL